MNNCLSDQTLPSGTGGTASGSSARLISSLAPYLFSDACKTQAVITGLTRNPCLRVNGCRVAARHDSRGFSR